MSLLFGEEERKNFDFLESYGITNLNSKEVIMPENFEFDNIKDLIIYTPLRDASMNCIDGFELSVFNKVGSKISLTNYKFNNHKYSIKLTPTISATNHYYDDVNDEFENFYKKSGLDIASFFRNELHMSFIQHVTHEFTRVKVFCTTSIRFYDFNVSTGTIYSNNGTLGTKSITNVNVNEMFSNKQHHPFPSENSLIETANVILNSHINMAITNGENRELCK